MRKDSWNHGREEDMRVCGMATMSWGTGDLHILHKPVPTGQGE
jgi:hypothetical protein